MSPKIAQLLRTNTALVLLCIISVGVLAILFRQAHGSSAAATDRSAEAPAPQVIQSPVSPNPSAPQASPGAIPADPSLADMPATSTFMSFLYQSPDETIAATSTCADAYSVTLIFPASIDYRVSPASAVYNTATPCTMGQPYSSTISLGSLHLAMDGRYYLIRASEGDTGTWHDPH